MSDAVTSYESWTNVDSPTTLCWSCKKGQYLVYPSDATDTSRCGQCGELEQDDPAKVKRQVAEPKTRPATRRATTKAKEKS